MTASPVRDTLAMLHAIEDAKVIYDIHYCNAGVGFIFYDGGFDETGAPRGATDGSWREHLTVERYHDTFEDAVASEYARLSPEAER